ncbi:MAG: ribosome maturation factor [Saprospiraceae bacterium]|nr:ribosome maturation factor [Saprospiraceae bacterium]
MELTARIAELLEQKFAADEAFADCFTVEVELKPVNRLNVFVDSDSGMDFDKCKGISRYLESHLDTQGWLGEKYVLEVSSPGITRPLKFPRQYVRNIGRALAVQTTEGAKHLGTLVKADDQQITLQSTHTEKEGKKKIEVTTETTIAYENIEKAVVKLAF